MRAGLHQAVAVLRVLARLAWLAVELAVAAGRGISARATTPPERRAWLHRLCRRLLPAFGITLDVSGPVPARGLLVANHLGYLDILLLAALTPCVFMAKSEVAAWPVFGWFARRAGTIFVHRRRRRDAARVNGEIRAALDDGALVVLFPEGTSSEGEKVLPFRSALLEAAVGETPDFKLQPTVNPQPTATKARPPISAAALHYELADGSAVREACYCGDDTLVPHLLRLLSRRGVRAAVSFASAVPAGADRKKLAAVLHASVSVCHAELRVAAAARSTGWQPGISMTARRLTSAHSVAGAWPIQDTAAGPSALPIQL